MSPRTNKTAAKAPAEPLPLAKALTRRTQYLGVGLDEGIAELYDRVTPVTAELLRWWFGAEASQARGVGVCPKNWCRYMELLEARRPAMVALRAFDR